MFKKVAMAMALLGIAAQAQADFAVGVNYGQYSESGPEFDVKLPLVTMTLGYQFDIVAGFSLTPELRYGVGVGSQTEHFSDTFYDYYYDDFYGQYVDILLALDGELELEIDKVISTGLRIQYTFDPGLYLFIAPAYTELKSRVNVDTRAYDYFSGELVGDFSESDSDGEGKLSLALGMGYQFNDHFGLEVNYETHLDDDNDYDVEGSPETLSAGLRFKF